VYAGSRKGAPVFASKFSAIPLSCAILQKSTSTRMSVMSLGLLPSEPQRKVRHFPAIVFSP
jgi:hypothetical protein